MYAPRGWISRSLPREMYRLFARSPYFDRKWYRARMSPTERWQDPLWHFIHRGGVEGRSPSPHFDSAYYLEKNDDVRVSRLNPLYHFLAHGKAERRLPLRSAKEMTHRVAPETATLRSFITPEISAPRVSVLLDSATPSELTADYVRAAAAVASARRSTLRVLFRGTGFDPNLLNTVLTEHGEEFLHAVEITPVPVTETYSDIPVYADETVLATSWSSAAALRHAAETSNSWVLVAAESPLSSPSSSPHQEVTGIPNTVGLVSSSAALRHAMALASEPWPADLADYPTAPARLSTPDSPWHLSILSDPDNSTTAFLTAIDSVSAWLATTTENVTISLSPLTAEPFAFFDDVRVRDPQDLAAPDCLLVMSSGEVPSGLLKALEFPAVIQVAPSSSDRDTKASIANHSFVEPEIGSIVSQIRAAHSPASSTGGRR